MTPRRANRLARWVYYTKISAETGKTPSAFFDQSRPIAAISTVPMPPMPKATPCAAHGNKTVLVLDGQAEDNGAARFFVSREDELSCPAAGRNPQI